MPVNKLALIRYKTIDACLANRYHKWTLEDIIEKVGEVLYEKEGITSGVSKRTIQADIQVMRSDRLGYNAPIIVTDKKYYSYSDPGYSITSSPMNTADVKKMQEVVGILRQFTGFTYFEGMNDLVARLENNLYKTTHNGKQYIQFESNHLVKGLEHITPLYEYILQEKSLLIEYKSFKAREARQVICYPYLLKEYRNRWFLIAALKKGGLLQTMALDRILQVQALDKEPFRKIKNLDLDTYYNDVIGVTKTEKDTARKVILFINSFHAPYVITKPIHQSQRILKQDNTGIIIQLHLVINFELEREIIGFGENLKVLSPSTLAKRICKRMEQACTQYNSATGWISTTTSTTEE